MGEHDERQRHGQHGQHGQHRQPRGGAVCPFTGATSGTTGGVDAERGTPSGLARRGFLGAVVGAAVALPAVTGGQAVWAAPKRDARAADGAAAASRSAVRDAPAALREAAPGSHAAPLRGMDVTLSNGRDAEGRFGFMLKGLKPFAAPEDVLHDLAVTMTDPRTMSPTRDPSDGDEFDNHAISGGYTFFGQFVDHDITRDPTPMPDQAVDPKALRNFDTPWLDLGSVYGEGPRRSPQLYDPARPGYLATNRHGDVFDLPRDSADQAHVGDPRNDENIIVAQLHAAFLEYHNALRDDGHDFATAQRLTRWHYQWMVVNEFLTRVCGQDLVDQMLSPSSRRHFRKHYRPKNKKKPMMPLEFSAAAYRFGHSMIRPEYEMNDADTGPVFPHPDDRREDLRGFRTVPEQLHADWTYFFDVPGRSRPSGHNFARLIDTKLALPLHGLPPSVVPPPMVNLATRNLVRGMYLGLPSGQAVAGKLGEQSLSNADLGLTDPRWGGEAPLWFYVLKEAELLHGGRRLGPVGGQIVGGVILGYLAFDPGSYLNARGGWKPERTPYTVGDFLLDAGVVQPTDEAEPEEPEEPEEP